MAIIQSWEKELMRENVNPWDYRYARSIPTKRKVFEFRYVYNICNLLMVLKPLIYRNMNWRCLGKGRGYVIFEPF